MIEHILPHNDVATLILVNIAVQDIVNDGALSYDVLEELKFLQPILDELVLGLKEKDPYITMPTKAMI